MQLTRRNFTKLVAATSAAAALGQLGRGVALAASSGNYRAMVGLFLLGGNDGWNMVVPTDARYADYRTARGSIALATEALTPLSGLPYALHASLAPLASLWNEGSLSVVLNAGTLITPLTRDDYRNRPELVPANLMSHPDEQAHWQAVEPRGSGRSGFMGRILDRSATGGIAPVISFSGNMLAVQALTASPLVLSPGGTRKSVLTDGSAAATQAACDSFARSQGLGDITSAVGDQLIAGYNVAAVTAPILGDASATDAYFVDGNGQALTSAVAVQLKAVARMIAARGTLGHGRQSFFVTHGSYDTHSGQVGGTSRVGGTQGKLFAELAAALVAFTNAMKGLGLHENVTTFTMSDFGRRFRGNAQYGTDHAWGNNHLVIGGGVQPYTVHGLYPTPVLGGADDILGDGVMIPTTAQEEYLGAIARWHGVTDADLPYVFPNWSTWSTGGRGPLPMFKA